MLFTDRSSASNNLSLMTVFSRPPKPQLTECGCRCESCVNNNSIHLHREIEHLKRQLAEREYHIMSMESQIMLHARRFPNGEMNAMQDSLHFWQEKYERLLEGHRKLQKVNQGLEDKLLRIADKYQNEKSALTQDVSELTNRLVDARVSMAELEEESDQYKNDCNIAVQLLQCKPSNFVAHKFNTLPIDLQERVKLQMNHRRTRSSPCNTSLDMPNNTNPSNGARVIRVPIPTFPPTAMVYSINKINEETLPVNNGSNAQSNESIDYVSAAIMAKVFEERDKERRYRKYQKCHQCRNRRAYVQYIDDETQTNNGVLNNEDYHYSNPIFNRQRSESSSSMESINNGNGSNRLGWSRA
ncbi:unnamed protein product [Medioppia subpectinata]|uniref:Tight junction-associated protein 1 n=1 Tax=Medioppia subpectinata TaxID=1979941 RepID=A0A7R9PW67_9ACAR|nr:unnamed protein product [Medioppia subpectinata]CAG2103397.1 unnamed protein product [Medioppia subpectinata]